MSKAVAIPECKKDVGGMKEEISISPSDKKEGAMGLFSRLLRFDSITKRSAPESPTSTDPPVTYYGVYIPCEIKKGPDEEAIHVYKNKTEALELVRRYKAARFKQFKCYQQAVSFALRGAEPTDNGDGNDSAVMGEKPYPFKAPSSQELVSLRKAIEASLAGTVRDKVWDNPRYLVSSGSTPAIMQEGCRYNALHIAAKSKNAEICNLILTTVGNPAFVQKLYGMDADPETCKEFSEILVDRYLNTPDKARNDTPLHFAAAYGAPDVVDVLTSYPQCDKTATNKFGEQPKDVICKRVSNCPSDTVSRIQAMLQDRYYVPVLHCEDEAGQPTIGRPFTPAQPPTINTDPLSPRYEIRAFAGPMDAHSADSFHKQWRTPPRNKHSFRLKEITKGLETEGRTLADRMKVGWKEYWPFLDTFTDLRTTEGLTLLENYLKAKYESACSFAYSDSCVEAQYTPDDLSISRLSLGNISHLGSLSSSPIKDMSPITELCAALRTCKISERPSHWKKTDPIRQRLCRQPGAKITNGDSPTTNHTVSQLLCIERTCQVFTKRIIDALTFCLTEQEIAGHSLKCEYKNLQHTIFTYMDDERFQNIDVASIHARLAQLVVYKLRQQTKEEDLKKLIEFLKKLRSNDDLSSDEDRKTVKSSYKIAHIIECHVKCLCSFLVDEFLENDSSKGPAISENECTEIWEKACKCRCDWKVEPFERNSKKSASFRKNRWALSVSPKSEGIIKRLTFDYDIGDGKLHSPCLSRPVSVNSPAGDSGGGVGGVGGMYAIDVGKCQVVKAEISSDESGSSSDDDYRTASEHSESEDDMMDASDRALAEPFIYGEEPTKMDRLVYEAIAPTSIDPEQFPNIYRWRHHVALYSPTQRDHWPAAPSPDTPDISCNWSTDVISRDVISCDVTNDVTSFPSPRRRPAARSTPRKDGGGGNNTPARGLPLQMSNWLRVTGPNSPRSVLASKSVGHNVSFGF